MSNAFAVRFCALLAGLWAGLLVGIGIIGAPSGFAVLPTEWAGRVAAKMFQQEAYSSLALSIVLLLIVRGPAQRSIARTSTSSLERPSLQAMFVSAETWLVLGALFCTVLGYFALLPLMAEARAGRGALSFGALHGASAMLYAAKMVLTTVLAWRLTRLATA